MARPSISFVDRGDGDVDAALQVHRVHAGGNELDAFLHDRGGKHGRCRRAVAGEIVGLRGNFAHHLCAHILELVGKLDLLRHGHAVLGDPRSTVGLVDHDVAALRAERHFDGVVEGIDTVQKPVACVGGKSNVLGSHDLNLLLVIVADAAQAAFLSAAAPSITPMMSDSFMIRRSSPSILHLRARPFAEQHAVAGLDIKGDDLAALVARPGADGDDFALLRLLLGVVWNDDAALRLLLAFDATDDDAVVQRTKFHGRWLPTAI